MSTTTALSARTPLNMNSTSTSTCDVARRSSLAGSGVPSGRVSVARCWNPHAVSPMTMSVRIASARSSFRRAASRMVSRAIVSAAIAPPRLAGATGTAPRGSGASAHRVDARTACHELGDQVRDGVRGQPATVTHPSTSVTVPRRASADALRR